MNNDTIVAPATALINQPLGIIRLSGSESHKIINQIIKKPIANFNNIIYYRSIYNKDQVIDQCLIMTYQAPHSFTGEDMIEINCHGGTVVVNQLLELLILHGARMAERGEYSKRAFFNKKINLVEAESIHSLIMAPNRMASQIAITNLTKSSYHQLKTNQKLLLDLIANINVNIDYPEYDGVGDLTIEDLNQQLINLRAAFNKIVELSVHSRYINEGIKTVIIGKPNVGKSSLLNALLQEDKALVSDIKGTTRDLVEGKVNLFDITLNLIDSAGIHQTDEQLEQAGINKALAQLPLADLVLLVIDGSCELDYNDQNLLKLTESYTRIIILNKVDLGCVIDKHNFKSTDLVCQISAKNANLTELYQAIKSQFMDKDLLNNYHGVILTNVNQIAQLKRVVELINIAQNESKQGVPTDLVVIHLETAWTELNQLLGDSYDETVIDAMFKNYCLGK